MIDQDRRLSFGSVAEQYDRSRPDYPPELIHDVIALSGSQIGDEVLEIGAGTGKATRMFCARGLSVVAVEPDGEMAAVASRKAATAEHTVRVIEADFESAELPDRSFGLAYSAQAWHWVDPATGYERARGVLRDGGLLAAFWNRIDWTRCDLRGELVAAYERAGAAGMRPGPMHPGASDRLDMGEEWHPERAAAAGFGELEVRRYERVLEYTAAGYVELLATHGDHIMLPAEVRALLLGELAAIIEDRGGVLRLPAPTVLCLARAL